MSRVSKPRRKRAFLPLSSQGQLWLFPEVLVQWPPLPGSLPGPSGWVKCLAWAPTLPCDPVAALTPCAPGLRRDPASSEFDTSESGAVTASIFLLKQPRLQKVKFACARRPGAHCSRGSPPPTHPHAPQAHAQGLSPQTPAPRQAAAVSAGPMPVNTSSSSALSLSGEGGVCGGAVRTSRQRTEVVLGPDYPTFLLPTC